MLPKVVGMVLVALLLVSCQPVGLPAGQVKGVLVGEDGQPVAWGNTTLWEVIEKHEDGGYKAKMRFQAQVDSSGEFLFEDVPPREYVLHYWPELGGGDFLRTSEGD
jgi:hypothetical protein